MLNKVILIGNLGRDPELTQTQSGKNVTQLSVATSQTSGGKDYTEWHRVVVWGNTAQACAKYLEKGRQVYIEGRLQTRAWEDKSGNKRYTTEIVASTVKFLGRASQSSDNIEDVSAASEEALKVEEPEEERRLSGIVIM